MKRIVVILAIAGTLAAAFWLWRVFFPPDRILVRRLIEQAAKSASHSSPEGELGRLTRAAELRSLCADNIHIQTDGNPGVSLEGRDAVFSAMQQAANVLGEYQVRLVELSEPVLNDSTAVIHVVVSLEGGGRDASTQELKISATKFQRKWLMSRIESVRALRK